MKHQSQPEGPGADIRHDSPSESAGMRPGGTRETRRRFLRTSGAGVVGLAFGNLSRARADEGDDTTLTVVDCESDGSIPDDQIWIDGVLTPVPEDLEDGNDLSCYDPNDAADSDPTVESFEIDSSDSEGSGDPVVDYDWSEDTLEVDMSVLEEFEELYDPDLGGPGEDPEDYPYNVEDSSGGSIGIDG